MTRAVVALIVAVVLGAGAVIGIGWLLWSTISGAEGGGELCYGIHDGYRIIAYEPIPDWVYDEPEVLAELCDRDVPLSHCRAC